MSHTELTCPTPYVDRAHRPVRPKRGAAAGGRASASSINTTYEDDNDVAAAESQALLAVTPSLSGAGPGVGGKHGGSSSGEIQPEDVGLGTPSAVLRNILNRKLFAMQTFSFYLLLLLNVALVGFCFSFWVGEAFGR